MIKNVSIIHKIALYVKDKNIVKILLQHEQYHELIKSSNAHYDDLIFTYWNFKTYDSKTIRKIFTLYSNKDIRIIIPNYCNKYTSNYGTFINNSWIDYASKENNLEMIKFLMKNKIGYFTTRAIDFAARYGYFEIVKYFSELGYSHTMYAKRWSGQNKHKEIVKYLRKYRCSRETHYHFTC